VAVDRPEFDQRAPEPRARLGQADVRGTLIELELGPGEDGVAGVLALQLVEVDGFLAGATLGNCDLGLIAALVDCCEAALASSRSEASLAD
jgi:hypothetical protein